MPRVNVLELNLALEQTLIQSALHHKLSRFLLSHTGEIRQSSLCVTGLEGTRLFRAGLRLCFESRA